MSRSFVKKTNGVAERQVRDVCILVPISSSDGKLGALYELNEVGAAIWNQAKEGSSEDAIVEQLVSTYQVAPEEAAADARQILDDLLKLGALEEQGG